MYAGRNDRLSKPSSFITPPFRVKHFYLQIP
jgi:hypothetical protein